MANKIEPSKGGTLLDLSDDILAFESQLIESDGEITDEGMEELLTKYFEDKEKFQDKIDNYVALIKARRARAEIRKAEASRLTGLQKSDEGTAERLEARLNFIFELHGIKEKFSTTRFNFSQGVSGGVAPLWIDPAVDPAQVDKQFLKPQKPELSNTAIREWLEKGNSLDWARIEEKKEKVKVR